LSLAYYFKIVKNTHSNEGVFEGPEGYPVTRVSRTGNEIINPVKKNKKDPGVPNCRVCEKKKHQWIGLVRAAQDIARDSAFVGRVAERTLENELPRELRLKRFPPSARFTVRKSPVTRTSNGLGQRRWRKTLRDPRHLRASTRPTFSL